MPNSELENIKEDIRNLYQMVFELQERFPLLEEQVVEQVVVTDVTESAAAEPA